MRVLGAAVLLVTLLGLRSAAQTSRDLLWLAVQTCATLNRLTGHPVPCVSLDAGTPERIGTAVLRAPGSEAHLVVVPLSHMSGIEASILEHRAGRDLWRAALAARSITTAAFRGALALEDVALAVNSAGGRSQDHLHIHVSCVEPGVRTALRRHPAALQARQWRALAFRLEDTQFFGMRIPASEAETFNPFEALTRLPGVGAHPRDVSMAAVGTASDDPESGLFILAYHSGDGHAEKLLDHSCAVARPPPAQ